MCMCFIVTHQFQGTPTWTYRYVSRVCAYWCIDWFDFVLTYHRTVSKKRLPISKKWVSMLCFSQMEAVSITVRIEDVKLFVSPVLMHLLFIKLFMLIKMLWTCPTRHSDTGLFVMRLLKYNWYVMLSHGTIQFRQSGLIKCILMLDKLTRPMMSLCFQWCAYERDNSTICFQCVGTTALFRVWRTM